MKKTLSACLILVSTCAAAQSVEADYNEFKMLCSVGNAEKALEAAQSIEPRADSLPRLKKAVFFNEVARLYEGKNESEKSLSYYSKVIKLEPHYYVPYLASGYLYLATANRLVPVINASKQNKAKFDTHVAAYKSCLRKAVPLLEKALACDPNEQVAAALNRCYEALKDQNLRNGMKGRVEALGKDCVSLLAD